MSKTKSSFKRIFSLVAPWVCFGAFFLWGWRLKDIFHELPAYGDTLEIVWGLQWYYEALFVNHTSPWFIATVFYPQGWHPATLAHTPFFFALLMPLYLFGGGAFAFNAAAILGAFVAFGGMFRAARWYVPVLPATIAATAYTFSGPLWIRMTGHLNILWGAALIPWLAWSVIYARRGGFSRKSIIGVGLMWGLMINISQYFLFLGAILLFVLVFDGSIKDRNLAHRLQQQFRIFGVIGLTALIVSLPTILLFMWGRQQDHMVYWDLTHIALFGASPNSLFIPSIFHPWFHQLIRQWIYRGPIDESGVMNLGLIASVLALLSFWRFFKEGQIRRLYVLVAVGLILALGLLLRWDGEFIQITKFMLINRWVWTAGHALKPELFIEPNPVGSFVLGVPLPGFLLNAIVPTWEGIRTISRFGLLSLFGIIMLAAISLHRIPNQIVKWAVIALWLVEVVPLVHNVRVPLPQPHPAYTWLADQPMSPAESVADFVAPRLYIEGETLFATNYHHQSIVAGAGSQWPAGTAFFHNWFIYHSLVDPDSLTVLRAFEVRYILLHMKSEAETKLLADLKTQTTFQFVSCFEKPSTLTAWDYSICVLEVLPTQSPFAVTLKEGWGEPEDWGVWAIGEQSQADWVATVQKDYRLHLTLFPYCLEDKRQAITIRVNNEVIDNYHWQTCDQWDHELIIPKSMVKIGMNHIEFSYDFAALPENSGNDKRLLAVGFTALDLTPVSDQPE